MSDQPTEKPRNRIVDLHLDEKLVVRRNPTVEHERSVAVFDLLEDNSFALVGHDGGPYRLRLGLEENRLIFDIRDEADQAIDRLQLPLIGMRGIIRDYFTVCETYYQAIKSATLAQIEAVDMGRRGLHNEGSELLRERLADRVSMDFDTARRLFTLICVLHIRG